MKNQAIHYLALDVHQATIVASMRTPIFTYTHGVFRHCSSMFVFRKDSANSHQGTRPGGRQTAAPKRSTKMPTRTRTVCFGKEGHREHAEHHDGERDDAERVLGRFPDDIWPNLCRRC
jgi:hypothetical protein